MPKIRLEQTISKTTMPRIICTVCNRQFSSTQYYNQHLAAESNVACRDKNILMRMRVPSFYNLSRPRGILPSKRNNSGNTVKEGRGDQENEGTHMPEFSVFDFVPSDDEPDPAPATHGNGKEAPEKCSPDASIRDKFGQYVDYANRNFERIVPEMAAAIELMKIMDDAGCGTALYNRIMDWHVSNLVHATKISAKELLEFLVKRYDLEATLPYERAITLPFSKAKLNISCHDALAMSRCLLTDPRIKEEEYLFFDDDPLKGPPDEFKILEDVNTGLCYRETYDKLIRPQPYSLTGRRKILLPYIFYLDSCVTGAFSNLSLEMLKFTFGIFKRELRDKDHAWRGLGYVPRNTKQGTRRAKEFVAESAHADAERYVEDASFKRGGALKVVLDTPNFDASAYLGPNATPIEIQAAKTPKELAQDFHKVLQTILWSYKELQDKNGFEWDLFYKGEQHKLQCVPFIMFIKGDGKEHDKHCGQYQSKTKGVGCLCRYCTIPTQFTDQPYYDKGVERKTQPMIEKLMQNNDKKRLKELSQQPLWNAWYPLRFGLHNDLGVHGACPIEILHWILLGMYKYDRSSFFNQTGESSALGLKLNDIASTMGILLQRQSDRDKPPTSFSRGVNTGKLSGHEMSGMILVLTATLRCTQGRRAILEEARGNQKDFFPNSNFVRDWIMLLETQLQFESWLKSPQLTVQAVERAKTKVCELMGMIKQVGKRQEGMANTLMNFHGTKHVPEDILFFGVPSNVDTFSNERHHKRDKKTAQRTQKRPDTVDIQTATKIIHRTAVDFAMEELGGRPRWHYFAGYDHSPSSDDNKPQQNKYNVGGTSATFFRHPNNGNWVCRVNSHMNNKAKYKFDQNTVTGMTKLCEFFEDDFPELTLHSELTVHDEGHDKQIYRGSPYCEGRPWQDWADFDDPPNDNSICGQFFGFVDLREMTPDPEWGEPPGIYALVEKAFPALDESEMELSDLWEPHIKEAREPKPHEDQTKLYNDLHLLNVNLILGPAIVIPDLANRNKRAYLRMIPRCEWAGMFEDWLQNPHERNFEEEQTTKT